MYASEYTAFKYYFEIQVLIYLPFLSLINTIISNNLRNFKVPLNNDLC